MSDALTILICTHNRTDLLALALASLNAAQRPVIPVQILVAANACTYNDTHAETINRLYKTELIYKRAP